MRAKTIVDLMSLSVSLYMLSRDEELLRKAAELTAKGKEKAGELLDALTGEDGEDAEEKLIAKILRHATKLKEEIDAKADEVAATVYNRLHIAHTNEIKKIADEIALLRTELALAEAKIINLESQIK